MSKKAAIIQSNYIPWKGYFDIINSVDEFILYDEVQYTKRDWRNRNKIKSKDGLRWLTIPTKTRGKFTQAIKDTTCSDYLWVEKHWRSMSDSYKGAEFYSQYSETVRSLYLSCLEEPRLSQINYKFIRGICEILGITTKITWSMDYPVNHRGKSERLLDLCNQVGADVYVSGPAAQGYIEMEKQKWDEANIRVEFFSYQGYPEYPQLYPPFEHTVSVLDLIFVAGDNASKYMLSF